MAAVAASVVAASVATNVAQAARAQRVGFTALSLYPRFEPSIHDYVVRCYDAPITVGLQASGGWRAAIGSGALRAGRRREKVAMRAGQAFVVTTQRRPGAPRRRYHVRCLPNNFPSYRYTRTGPAHLRYFSVDASFFIPYPDRYAIIFDDNGVPVWWSHTTARGTQVLPGGRVVWFDRTAFQWEIHDLDGTLVRALPAVGAIADLHDVQMTGDGDHLVGVYETKSHVDTSAYGGSPDANVLDTELQQVTPDGQLAWDWHSADHISLSETGRWWPHVLDQAGPYDITHWNSIEPDGGSVIASFRNLDAVYRIDKATGGIVWKLGGTRTPQSLKVKGDPRQRTFGGQHDARLLADGTLTVFDDRTGLAHPRPRALRFRVDARTRTATLLQSVTDPDFPASSCCGSARRLSNGSWLIDWGRNPSAEGLSNGVGGYDAHGRRTFLLRFRSTASYRAEPVPRRALNPRRLRKAMRVACRAGCG